jgi:DNA-binding XRE family transcriptional regulator
MQVHVKTLHTEIDMTGEISEEVLSVLKKVYGKKLTISDDDEYVNIRDTVWFKKMEGVMTPGKYMSIYRKLRKMTQSELGEKLGGISKQNISHMERGVHPISKKIAKQLAELFNVPISRFI